MVSNSIIVFTATQLVGCGSTGRRSLLEFPWEPHGGINPSQPLVLGDDRVFVSTGYGMGAALFSLSQHGGTIWLHERWRTNRMKNQFTSSVYHDGYIYGLDEEILACVDAASGALQWKGGRYCYGQMICHQATS